MGSQNSKVQCLLRPGQSGKTRKMQELIREYEGYADLFLGPGTNPLNIVITSNNIALSEQTSTRMNRDLYETESVDSDDDKIADAQVNGTCFSWTSGSKGMKVSEDALFSLIVRQKIAMIVCCANKRRLTYIFNLLKMLNEYPAYRPRINVWIDEADASIKLWSNPALDVTALPNVTCVTLVSATFNSVLKKYERLRIIGCAETHPEVYHRVSDCIQEHDASALGARTEVNDRVHSSADYLAAVLTKHPAWNAPGMKLFTPGNHVQSSHDENASFLVKRGFAVLVLNGNEKAIRLPYGLLPIRLEDTRSDEPEEIGLQVARLYKERNLKQFPFAVTGHMCVGRGLTFQNEHFLFDAGVIPYINDPAMAYQTACRLAGNIKKIPGYKPSTIVASPKMLQTILRQEMFAVNLARIVHERKLEDVGIEEFNEAAGEERSTVSDYALSPTFETSELAKDWCEIKLTYGSSIYGRHTEICTSPRCMGCGTTGTTHIKYRGKLREILSEDQLRASIGSWTVGANLSARIMPVSWIGTPEAADKARIIPVEVSWGVADSARIMPVTSESTIAWIAIFKKDKLRRFKASEFFSPR
jgi:hypothetical protein